MERSPMPQPETMAKSKERAHFARINMQARQVMRGEADEAAWLSATSHRQRGSLPRQRVGEPDMLDEQSVARQRDDDGALQPAANEA